MARINIKDGRNEVNEQQQWTAIEDNIKLRRKLAKEKYYGIEECDTITKLEAQHTNEMHGKGKQLTGKLSHKRICYSNS